jgi:hypothetical protein
MAEIGFFESSIVFSQRPSGFAKPSETQGLTLILPLFAIFMLFLIKKTGRKKTRLVFLKSSLDFSKKSLDFFKKSLLFRAYPP